MNGKGPSIASLIHFAGVVFYAIFASGEEAAVGRTTRRKTIRTKDPPGTPGERLQRCHRERGCHDLLSFSEVKQPSYGATTTVVETREELPIKGHL
ncbi:hypothetical protein CEXT_385081 [Caerostris extrusa]|uniref:Secreted protein n=1 Tax=Caerostris extrusa TaxID=172846 RepID=A0AAV4QPN7_CAEEX|nr:hypothetical protein CEXT_385081 [Caerostris extrusa]